jgi:hypothetical protein
VRSGWQHQRADGSPAKRKRNAHKSVNKDHTWYRGDSDGGIRKWEERQMPNAPQSGDENCAEPAGGGRSGVTRLVNMRIQSAAKRNFFEDE